MLGRGAEKKATAAYCDAKANVPRCSSVPWSILLENVEGKPTKTVPVASKLKDPTFKALSPETPSWICEVSSALGSVQTVQTGEGSDALKNWLSRWQQQMQQRSLQAKAGATASSTSFQLKPTRAALKA